jgi:hypothetical protein
VADALFQDVGTGLVDAMTCGMPSVDAMFTPLFPSCAECLATPSEAGARTCCGENSNCAMDSACSTILQCELGCTAGPGLCGCAGLNGTGVTDFNNFVGCLTSICPTLCPPLTQVTGADL